MPPPLPYGRYRAVSSAELLEWIERTFVLPAAEPDRAAIRREALEELTLAELELVPGDQVVSRAGEQEWVRVQLPAGATQAASFTFDKAPGVTVRIERPSDDLLLAFQVGKPAIQFRRVEVDRAPAGR
jgi:hypothetical protein